LEEYHKKYLAGQWGNHLSRVMGPKMLSLLPSDENKVTLSKPESNEEDKSMVEALEQLASKFDEHTSKFEVNRALETISDVLAQSNYHFQTLAPWQEKATVRHRQRAMYYAYETCRIAALLSQSILPRKMQTMLDILQVKIMDRKWSDALKLQDSISITSGAKIEPIFPNFVNSDDNDEGILRPDNGKLRRHAHKHKKRAKYGMIN
jgi:methionyl-tRNA synthetase